jgi:hypothetical protein
MPYPAAEMSAVVDSANLDVGPSWSRTQVQLLGRFHALHAPAGGQAIQPARARQDAVPSHACPGHAELEPGLASRPLPRAASSRLGVPPGGGLLSRSARRALRARARVYIVRTLGVRTLGQSRAASVGRRQAPIRDGATSSWVKCSRDKRTFQAGLRPACQACVKSRRPEAGGRTSRRLGRFPLFAASAHGQASPPARARQDAVPGMPDSDMPT